MNETSDTHIEKDLLNTDESEDRHGRQAQAERVVNLGLGANAVLAAAKLSAGIFGHSQALLADGINSISDVVYFIVVRILVTLSGKPADEEHPYGHHQFESIAALVVGAFVITTGLAIFWHSASSAYDLLTGAEEETAIRLFTLIVAVATIFVKIALLAHAKRVVKSTKSLAVMALASDHRNDIVASIGAAIGILFGLLGYRIFDPAAGAIVAVIVVKTGVDILRESAMELMDSVPSKEIDARIRDLLNSVSEVKTVESVHAHRFGPYLVANVTLGVDGDLTVSKGDAIADEAERTLYREIPMLKRVYIHYHPPDKTDIAH
jgi:cation diffusion facilitator family transporter